APHPVVAADMRHDVVRIAVDGGGHHGKDGDPGSGGPTNVVPEGGGFDGIDENRRDALHCETIYLCSLARAVAPGRDDAHIELQAIGHGGHAPREVCGECAGIRGEGDADAGAAVSLGAATGDGGRGEENGERCSHTAKVVNALDFRDALFYQCATLKRGARV